jgi:hypothetical protein
MLFKEIIAVLSVDWVEPIIVSNGRAVTQRSWAREVQILAADPAILNEVLRGTERPQDFLSWDSLQLILRSLHSAVKIKFRALLISKLFCSNSYQYNIKLFPFNFNCHFPWGPSIYY